MAEPRHAYAEAVGLCRNGHALANWGFEQTRYGVPEVLCERCRRDRVNALARHRRAAGSLLSRREENGMPEPVYREINGVKRAEFPAAGWTVHAAEYYPREGVEKKRWTSTLTNADLRTALTGLGIPYTDETEAGYDYVDFRLPDPISPAVITALQLTEIPGSG